MKYEWKKEEKDIYLPKDKPVIINIPKMKYFCIKGIGNPNSEDFSKRVEALYGLSYTVKMIPKGGYTPKGYFDYTVYPLEGLWDLTEYGRELERLNKDELVYKIMIRQQKFVDNELFEKAKAIAKIKKKSLLFDEVTFEELEDGLVVQMLHIGSYDNENASFDKMKEFIKDNNLELKTLVHKEIYLSDPRKTSEDKLKTVLRYMVSSK